MMLTGFENSCLNSPPPGGGVATSLVSPLAFSIDVNLMFLLMLLTEKSVGATGDSSTNCCLTDLGFGPLIYFYRIPKALERSQNLESIFVFSERKDLKTEEIINVSHLLFSCTAL
ncbi:hypothetical protein HA466_0092170 [Hirschfeldia incana]|nr:hypothetical protein HA466_0207350 [Hirschfeldia incana]KAJ0256231.1 hypothetical protein HA466_0092170 [Hirschfeldia incana]